MNMLYALIPLALLLIAAAAWALIWAIRSGQFDDLDSQGWSVVLDEDQELAKKSPPGDERSDGLNEEPGDERSESSNEAEPDSLKHDGG